MAGRQTDFDRMDPSDASVSNQLTGKAEICLRTLPAARLPDDSIAAHRITQNPSFPERMSQGFFTVNIFAGAGGFDRNQGMPMVRQGQHYRINSWVRHHLAVIRVAFTVLILVMVIDPPAGLFKMIAVYIADSNHLCVRFGQKGPQIGAALPAHSDTANGNSIAG